MSTQLPTIAPYLPSILVQAALDHPERCGRVSSERFPAAVLFADVSQFTLLTQEIVRQGAEGPEELGRLLNRFFASMVSRVRSAGGHVAKFGGDALTAFFAVPDEPLGFAVQRAWQAALSMQESMAEFDHVETRFGSYTLDLKIGIGAGQVCAMHVGGLADRWEYVLGGDALVQALEAEEDAAPGGILLSAEARALLPGSSVELAPISRSAPPVFSVAAEVESTLRCYLPLPVRGWLCRDLHDWLAVLHPMTVLFLGVQGIDYEQSGAVYQLDAVVKGALQEIYRYEGTLARVSVDDKGTALLVLFGAPPYTHEDDPVRAVRCALDLAAAVCAAGGGELSCAVGVSSGQVFAGPVGGRHRREYTVMGNAVNLAAKLTEVGSPGPVLCDYGTFQAAQLAFEFESLAPIRIKGRAGFIRVYRPTGRVSEGGSEVFALTGQRQWVDWDPATLLGRSDEIDQFRQALDDVEAGESRVLVVEGEAGIGKSRLVVELTRLARERGLTWLAGAGRSVEQQTPYLAWRDVFAYYFDLDEIPDADARRERVMGIVAELVPDLADGVAVLGDVLKIGFTDATAKATLDPGLRQQQLTDLLLALLKAWTREQPLIIVLEDAHWLDSLSWEMVLRITEPMVKDHEPFLLVVSMRPLESSEQRLYLERLLGMPETSALVLSMLTPDDIVLVAASRLGVPVEALPEAVVRLVQRRAGGNPFFAQELAFSLREQGLVRVSPPGNGAPARCLLSPDFDRAASLLPETVQGLLLARVARLSPESQLTLKVASVIGRVFTYRTLRQTLSRYSVITDDLLDRQLDELAELDLAALNRPASERTYRFKHVITQQVAYQTLLFAQRRAVHRTVAETLEHLYPDRTVEMVGLLAHHWDQAGYPERAIGYLLQAGAHAHRAYANSEAVACFSRVLELVSELSDQAGLRRAHVRWQLEALRGLGKVRFGLGELEEANRLFRQAIGLGKESGLPRNELLDLYHWLGEVLWWQGECSDPASVAEEALVLLGQDKETLEAVGDVGTLEPRELAAILAGLERAIPAESYRKLCNGLQTRVGDGGILQWHLVDDDISCLEDLCVEEWVSFADPFEHVLAEGWSWHDPLEDSSFALDCGLLVQAANGRDLVGGNSSAPRLLRKARGDLVVEAVCALALDGRPALGGIVLWWDQDSYVRLDWGRRDPREIELGGCMDGRDVVLGRGMLPSEVGVSRPELVYLRLSRAGQEVRAWCSLDGALWYSVGEAVLDQIADVDAGVFAIGATDRRATPQVYPEGSAIRFRSFRLCSQR